MINQCTRLLLVLLFSIVLSSNSGHAVLPPNRKTSTIIHVDSTNRVVSSSSSSSGSNAVLNPTHADPITPGTPNDSRHNIIVCIGSILGDSQKFNRILRISNIIDGNGRWVAENTVLMIMGDLLGTTVPTIFPLFNLVQKLEKEAVRFHSKIEWIVGESEVYLLTLSNTAAATAYSAQSVLHPTIISAFSPSGYIYRYFITQAKIAVKYGAYVFSYAGLSPTWSQLTLNALNDQFKQSIRDKTCNAAGILSNEGGGPVTYRQYSSNSHINRYQVCRKIKKSIRNLSTRFLVLGRNFNHETGLFNERCEGHLIFVDAGPRQCGAVEINLNLRSNVALYCNTEVDYVTVGDEDYFKGKKQGLSPFGMRLDATVTEVESQTTEMRTSPNAESHSVPQAAAASTEHHPGRTSGTRTPSGSDIPRTPVNTFDNTPSDWNHGGSRSPAVSEGERGGQGIQDFGMTPSHWGSPAVSETERGGQGIQDFGMTPSHWGSPAVDADRYRAQRPQQRVGSSQLNPNASPFFPHDYHNEYKK